jgi:predicted glycosyltransferase
LLFRALLNRLTRELGIQVVVCARTEAQELELRQRYGLSPEKFKVSVQAVDGLSLMWFSDAVFSGGGTMVREAALLGLNVHSFFGGRIAAADEYLVSQGRLRLLREPGEIDALALPTMRTNRPAIPNGRSMAPFITQEILRFVRETSSVQRQGGSVRPTRIPERTPAPSDRNALLAVEGTNPTRHRSP